MPTDSCPVTGAWSRWGLLTALGLAACLQAWLVAHSPIIAKDGIRFHRIARELQRDPIRALREEDQHPGYPALALACSWALEPLRPKDDFQASIWGLRLASGLAGLLCVILVWLLARRMFDSRTAGVAALLVAALPLFRQSASDTLSDSPHLVGYLAAAWLVCEGLLRGGAWRFALAGLASGLAYWIRPEGAIVSLLASLALFAWILRRADADRGAARRQAAANPPSAFAPTRGQLCLYLATLLLVTGATMAPYMVLARKVTSKKNPFREPAVASTSPVPLAESAPAPKTPILAIASPNAASTPLAVAKTPGLIVEPSRGERHADELARPNSRLGVLCLAFYEFGKEGSQGLLYFLVVPLALGHFAPGRARPESRAFRLLLLLCAGHACLLVVLFYTAGYISHRHLMPLLAVGMPCTASGLLYLVDLASKYLPARWPRPLFLPAALLVVVGMIVPKSLEPVNQVHAPLVAAAHWVQDHALAHDRVLSTSSYVRFYSGLEGRIVGPEIPNLRQALDESVLHPWNFLVLEVDQRTFDVRQVALSGVTYEPVLDLAAHPRKSWSRVLVYQAKRGDSLDGSQQMATGVRSPSR